MSRVTIKRILEGLGDREPLTRAKSVGLFYELLKSGGIEDMDSIIDNLLTRLDDEALWIRDMIANTLWFWGKAHPKRLFQKVSALLIQNLKVLEFQNPPKGNSLGDHLLRLLMRVYQRTKSDEWKEVQEVWGTRYSHDYRLQEELNEFIAQLRDKYENEGDKTYMDKVIRVMQYLSSHVELESWPWDEASAASTAFPDRPQVCWTCAHWRPHHVPVEELEYVKTEEYWYHSEFSPMNIYGGLDEEHLAQFLDLKTGQFLPKIDIYGEIWLHGHCMIHHQFRHARDQCAAFAPRELKPPITEVLVHLEGVRDEVFLYRHLVTLDSVMYWLLWHWFSRIQMVRPYVEPVEDILSETSLTYKPYEYSLEYKFSALHYEDEEGNEVTLPGFPSVELLMYSSFDRETLQRWLKLPRKSWDHLSVTELDALLQSPHILSRDNIPLPELYLEAVG